MGLSNIFDDLFKKTASGLSIRYCEIENIDVGSDEFWVKIVAPIHGGDDSRVVDPYGIIKQFVSLEEKEKGGSHLSGSPKSAIIVATTFLMRSLRTYQEGNLDLAWSHLAAARYWYGVLLATGGIEKAYEKTVVDTRRETALKGAKARDEKYAPARLYAQNLAREKLKKNIGWGSRNHAVQSIKSQVLQYAAAAGIGLRESYVENTLDKWLAEMPDADELFPRRKLKKEL